MIQWQSPLIALSTLALLTSATLTSPAHLEAGTISSPFASLHLAQPNETVECGDEVQGEFFVDNAEVDFYINLDAGDILILDGHAPEAQFVIQFHAPDDTTRLGESPALSLNPELTTVAAPVGGTYNVEADNHKDDVSGGVGTFSLRIGCLVRGGATLILPYHHICPECQTLFTVEQAPSVMRLPDLSEIVPEALQYNTPLEGAIGVDNESMGFTFEVEAPQTLHLIFTRGSGVLSMGLAVVGASGYLFQGGIIGEGTQSLEARVTLPAVGQYMIAVYPIDVLIPATAEPTAFTLYASPV